MLEKSELGLDNFIFLICNPLNDMQQIYRVFIYSLLFLNASCTSNSTRMDNVDTTVEKQDLSKWEGNYHYNEDEILRINYQAEMVIGGKTIAPTIYASIVKIEISNTGDIFINGMRAELKNDTIFCFTESDENTKPLIFPRLTSSRIQEINAKNSIGYKYTSGIDNVYIVGVEKCVATYWINGEVFKFNEGTETEAWSLFLTQNDLYAVGRDCDGHSSDNYWRNENSVNLPNRGNSSPFYGSIIYDVFVDGSDLYFAGQRGNRAAYWRNGVVTELTSDFTAKATSIYVTGKDIYVAGYSNARGASYWKNGEEFPLSNCNYTTSIYVENGNVYVSGVGPTEHLTEVAKYWKNGDEIILERVTGDGAASVANDIYVVDGVVYVAGKNGIDVYGWGECGYWKNNKWIPLTKRDNEGKLNSAQVYSIFVKDSDVYVAGYELGYADSVGAKYWKNGKGHPLSKDVTSKAYSIVVK